MHTREGGALTWLAARVAQLPDWPADWSGAAPLLGALRDAADVFYNASGLLQCRNPSGSVNNATGRDGEFWDYQVRLVLVQA